MDSYFKYENRYDIFTSGSIYRKIIFVILTFLLDFLSKRNFEKVNDIEEDKIKVLDLFSKLKNSSDDFFEWNLNYYIQNNDKVYDSQKKAILDDELSFTDDFKLKCLLLDEYVFDTNQHDEFAISTKYLDYHFLTQDFRNKLVNYEQKDTIDFKMPLDIKVQNFNIYFRLY